KNVAAVAVRAIQILRFSIFIACPNESINSRTTAMRLRLLSIGSIVLPRRNARARTNDVAGHADGYDRLNDKPGLGFELNERDFKRYPFQGTNPFMLSRMNY